MSATNTTNLYPSTLERTLRDYLACGLLQYGFAKAVCKVCGRTILVAFSCKKARRVLFVLSEADVQWFSAPPG